MYREAILREKSRLCEKNSGCTRPRGHRFGPAIFQKVDGKRGNGNEIEKVKVKSSTRKYLMMKLFSLKFAVVTYKIFPVHSWPPRGKDWRGGRLRTPPPGKRKSGKVTRYAPRRLLDASNWVPAFVNMWFPNIPLCRGAIGGEGTAPAEEKQIYQLSYIRGGNASRKSSDFDFFHATPLHQITINNTFLW